MKKISVVPVILSGGSGERLWPLSRQSFPKQFLSFSNSLSLFQQAFKRITSKDINYEIDKVLIVTNEDHRFLVLSQLEGISQTSINNNFIRLILEPEGRNTAPALTFAALEAVSQNKNSILVVVSSDHIILDEKSFSEAIKKSIEIASKENFVILGAKPLSPNTGFGYIGWDKNILQDGEVDVVSFHEKPSIEQARIYLENGSFAWNSGIFIMRASLWLESVHKLRPDILFATEKSFNLRTQDLNFIRPDKDSFIKIPKESIDFAIMEKLPNFHTIKLLLIDVGWKDLGTWEALLDIGEKDKFGNVIFGDSIINDTQNSLIYSTNRLIVTSKIKNLIIVETPDAILVLDRNQTESIKTIMSRLKERKERKNHRKIFRPWGWFDNLDIGDGFKVKRILVNPGAKLSLQRHKKRSEHWVVVRGIAKVICGDTISILKENESTYIPQGEVHQLSNEGKNILEIIEVQTGGYLEEDDIERFQDVYGRINT